MNIAMKLKHKDIWRSIDLIAEQHGLSPSGLALKCGMEKTSFNKSKRYAPNGNPRWPSTESISAILDATNCDIGEFFELGRIHSSTPVSRLRRGK